MAKLAELVRRTPRVVAEHAPGLVLRAVRQLVRKHGQRVAAGVGQEDVVAEGDGPPASDPEDEGA